MPRLALVFLPLILALASSPQTHAAEGLILINQHKVNESGGFPYSITRAGSYRLTGNLEVPAGVDAIVIAASGVSLDLDGFAILGSAGGSAQSPGSAVSVTGAISQVSVTNGTILNFSVGANLGNCTLCRVEHIKVTAVSTALIGGTSNLIANNLVNCTIPNFPCLDIHADSNVLGNIVAQTAPGRSEPNSNGIVASCPSNISNNTLSGEGISTDGTTCIQANNIQPAPNF